MKLSPGVLRLLPSPRVGALVIVVAALIVSTVIFRNNSGEAAGAVARLTGEPEDINERDTDGDGVKDWEEALWGFSAVSSDTDGDGVGDAQEVREEQLQLREQRLGLLSEAAGLSETTSYEGLSETEKISRGILEQVVAFQSAGVSLDGATTNDIAGVLGSVLQAPPAPVIQVSAADLSAVPESSATLAEYARALAAILGGKSTTQTNELLVLARFGETGNVATLDALADVIDTYGAIIGDLSAIPVPTTLLDEHAALINSFANTKQSIALLAQLGSDPVKAIQGLQIYTSRSQSVADTFDAIRRYLRGRITLGADDPGYIIIETTTE
ncbi:MAG TPA: hypothetical protein VJ837_03080 [Candidatus Paceibacterota bacterium]|nr:hypothetical protein [Candidatus Paceibacterota bacterium]